jgi:hypothetical protein
MLWRRCHEFTNQKTYESVAIPARIRYNRKANVCQEGSRFMYHRNENLLIDFLKDNYKVKDIIILIV